MTMDNIAFVLIGIAFLAILLVIGYSIYHLIKKKKKFRISTIGMNLLSLVFYCLVFLEAMKLSATTASSRDMIPFVLFDAFYVLTGFLYMVYTMWKKDKNISSIITIVGTTILMGFIFYWQMPLF